MVYFSKEDIILFGSLPNSITFKSLSVTKDNDNTIKIVENNKEIPEDAEYVEGLFTYDSDKNTIWDVLKKEFVEIDKILSV